MAFYFFNRCPEKARAKIEEIALSEKLEETFCEKDTRTWHYTGGSPTILQLGYKPVDNEVYLFLDTAPEITHQNNSHVLKILQQLIEVCKPTEIFDLAYVPYDMEEFK
jgi:hypothetical protein